MTTAGQKDPRSLDVPDGMGGSYLARDPIALATGRQAPGPYPYHDLLQLVKNRRPFLSPLMLAQEACPSPWAVALAAALHQRVRRAQGHPALWRLLSLWPRPGDLLSAGARRGLSGILAPCGLQNIREVQLRDMARAWLDGSRPYMAGFPGSGPYSAASYRLFVLPSWPVYLGCQDGELGAYVVWLILERKRGGNVPAPVSQRWLEEAKDG